MRTNFEPCAGGLASAFPSVAALRRTRDEADLSRAVIAYRFFYPSVAMHTLMERLRELGGCDNGAVLLMPRPWHTLFGADSDMPMLMAVLDLEASGPTVIDLPPQVFASIEDQHFGSVADLGLADMNGEKDDRYLVLPPDYIGRRVGYRTVASPTRHSLLTVRAVPGAGGLIGAINALRTTRIYPLGEIGKAAELDIAYPGDRPLDLTALGFETGLEFWDRLQRLAEQEGDNTELQPMYRLLAPFGFHKGQPVAQDPRAAAILERAACIGRDQMLVSACGSRRPNRRVWKDRSWEWASDLSENEALDNRSGADLDTRETWFVRGSTASPSFLLRKPARGAACWLALDDQHGGLLDGGKSYQLTIPQPVPANLFWSMTVYDAATRSQIQTVQGRATLRSRIELKYKANDDLLTLRFGPQPPAEEAEGEWIRTVPGKRWFAYLRLYDPTEQAFDGSWKPGDLEALGSIPRSRASITFEAARSAFGREYGAPNPWLDLDRRPSAKPFA